jgi:hypothetical protein
MDPDPDPYPDPDPSIFIIDLQDANKKRIFFLKFFCIVLFEGTFTSFFKDKKSKRSHKTVENQGFSYYFCLMIEGSRSGAGSGSIPLTIGSGSGSLWPKNMWIWWIRIRIRIRIRNTALNVSQIYTSLGCRLSNHAEKIRIIKQCSPRVSLKGIPMRPIFL